MVVGDGVADGCVVDAVERALESPAEVVDDAPPVSVSVPVAVDPVRSVTEDVVERVLRDKDYPGAPDWVPQLLEAYTGDPYAAAEALSALQRNCSRFRPDELRYCLAALDERRILPEATPTVRAVVTTLLAEPGPLSQQALAESAGVSPRSIRTNAAALAALDLVAVDDDGYRLTLPQRETDEGAEQFPAILVDSVLTPSLLLARVGQRLLECGGGGDRQHLSQLARAIDPQRRLSLAKRIGPVAGLVPAARALGDGSPRQPRSVTMGVADHAQQSLRRTSPASAGV